MTDTLAILHRTTGGEITFWSPGMERRYGFSSKEAVGQVADRLLKTVFSQTEDQVQTALRERHLWSGGLIHRHANGRVVLTANYWQTYPSLADRDAYVTEVHADILPAGATGDSPFVDLLDTIARSLAAGQTARNAEALHLLQDVVSAMHALPPTDEDIKEKHWRLMEESARTIEQSADIMRRSSDVISTLHSYRICLLDTQGRIEAAALFSASKNDDAADVARSVYEASDDVFSGYELWAGGQCISSMQGVCTERAKRRYLEDAVQAHQDTVVDLEEKLQRAVACVKRSRKLLQASARIRDRMADARIAELLKQRA